MFGSAPAVKSRRTISIFFNLVAHIRAVSPFLFAAFTSDFAFISVSTIAVSAEVTAIINGILPRLFLIFTSAPFAIKL